MDTPSLYCRRYGSGPPLVLLHGLFGSSDNWHTVARALAADLSVYALDLRNHGRSFHSARHDYAAMAEDVERFAAARGLAPVTLLGHSMGGKVAMVLAGSNPERVGRLIVVDITPKATPVLREPIAALRRLDFEKIGTLAQAEAMLAPEIPDPVLRHFLLKNAERTPAGRYRWRINLEAIERNLDRIAEAVPAGGFDKPCLFIRGGKSDYLGDADWRGLRGLFPAAELATLPEAGHWVHADARDAFIAVVRDFIRRRA